MDLKTKISALTAGTPLDTDIIPYVDLTDGITKKAAKSELKGDTGDNATATAGTTTTGNPGTDASVTNVGTTSDAIFNFVIPRGDVGAQGPAGTGDVIAPTTNTDSYIPQWDGADSKTLKNGLGLDTDLSSVSASDDTVPSAKATKTYVDSLVAGLLDYRGAYDASVNTFPAAGGSGTAGAVMKGDMWIISVAGTLGSVAVQVGDSVIANVDTPGQTATNWNILNANISYVPEDQANKKTSLTDDSDTFYPTQKAVKTAVDAKLAIASKATQSEVATGTDDTKYTTPLAVAPYANQSLFRQAIINGNFDVWQRGTSISVGASAYTYTCDRFKTFSANTATTVSQSTDVPAGFRYSLKLQRPNGNTGTNSLTIGQIIETANATYLVGKVVSVSFYAKVGANYSGGAMSFQLLTGTVADQGGDPYGWTGLAAPINSSDFTPTTTWARYTYTGTIASNVLEIMANLAITPTGTAGADDSLYITGVQLCAGSVALPFQPKSFAEELSDCQRYYMKAINYGGAGICFGTNIARYTVNFPVTMRIAPTILLGSGTNGLGFFNGTVTTYYTGAALSDYSTKDYFQADIVVNDNMGSGLLAVSYSRGADSFMSFSAEL